MNEMVEQVKIALIDKIGVLDEALARLCASIAIEAMRVPTERMRLAGSFAQDTPWAIYDAMIDAALAEDHAKAL